MIAAPEETIERRASLRRLDDILEALEQLNLTEAPELPERVRRSLAAHDIAAEPGIEIRVLIERVWRKQEGHMLNPRQERRRSSTRRSLGRRPPGHDVIESILRQSNPGSSGE
ncbi:MAG TPA: hypothetical protein VMV23_09260 [Candidatus Nanopelagicaceae bacterium]|nr:hypothetical protein [Candidatus Nanopelagicaceae bacterium]